MDCVPIVLKRHAGEHRVSPEQRGVNAILLIRVSVEDDVAFVGIQFVDVFRHRALFGGGLCVLFAQVPVECEQVTVAGNHFAQIKFPLALERAAIQCGGHWFVLPIVTKT